MSTLLKNIARYLTTGFLLLAVSGFTLAIHHEHSLGTSASQHEHHGPQGVVLSATPRSYHEVHLVRFLSGDSFNGSEKSHLKASLVKLFTVQLNPVEIPSDPHSASAARTDIRETGPPSVDACVLFCSFLI